MQPADRFEGLLLPAVSVPVSDHTARMNVLGSENLSPVVPGSGASTIVDCTVCKRRKPNETHGPGPHLPRSGGSTPSSTVGSSMVFSDGPQAQSLFNSPCSWPTSEICRPRQSAICRVPELDNLTVTHIDLHLGPHGQCQV